ncbi:hypothetical protein BDV96DRAFT_200069 [Lophiotrema nucula]|uniref:Uncharacterized protein n=1 Tax=Lophiotrema nucula TaxID=690887 RepID=A0A6A5YU76_9PLEO|nr:hypothetical protein BDV96DRAFT_200069 [Lophiotrema nucula]
MKPASSLSFSTSVVVESWMKMLKMRSNHERKSRTAEEPVPRAEEHAGRPIAHFLKRCSGPIVQVLVTTPGLSCRRGNDLFVNPTRPCTLRSAKSESRESGRRLQARAWAMSQCKRDYIHLDFSTFLGDSHYEAYALRKRCSSDGVDPEMGYNARVSRKDLVGEEALRVLFGIATR